MKLEQFEQEFQREVEILQTARFSTAHKDFKLPTYNYYTKAFSIAFAVPALVAMFAIFITSTNNETNKDLALLEESNNRILEQINTLDHENSI